MPLKRDLDPCRVLCSRWAGALLVLGLLATRPVFAQDSASGSAPNPAATLYEKSCYSCHNIGGGDKKGPDLMGVLERREHDWLHRFITSAQSVRDTGDPVAVQMFDKYAPEVMNDMMLSREQINQILDLIEEHSVKKKPFVPVSGKLARQPMPADVAAGHKLFIGQTKLAKRGAPCIGCHSVSGVGYLDGGRLGPDLTDATRRYTEVELASILKAPAFPTMSKLYADHQLNDEEVVQLFAYIRSARAQTPDSARASTHFLAWSAAGLIAVFGAMSLIWRGRLRHDGSDARAMR